MTNSEEHRTLNIEHRTPKGAGWDRFWRRVLLLMLLLISAVSRAQTNEQRTLVIVVGAAGEAEYGEQFAASAGLWKRAGTNGGFQISVVGERTNAEEDRVQL